MHEYINAIETELRRKTGEPITYAGASYNVHDRAARIELIRRLTEDYTAANDKYPEGALLERLADAVLNEELSDQKKNKTRTTEYPFLSERQFRTRHEQEVGLEGAATTGVDGRDYRMPKRRKRSNYENNFVDKHARSTNADRRKQYAKDKAPGKVTYVVSEPFTEARKQAAKWRDHLSLVY